jgi:hypothetical protein
MRTALFSTSTVAKQHKQTHYGTSMHPKFYENEFEATSIEELEFVRSPFYELAQLKHTESGPEAERLLTHLA